MTLPDTRYLINCLLRAIGQGGLMGVEIEAPHLLGAIDSLMIFDHTVTRTRRHELINQVRRQHLIEVTRESSRMRLQLTVKGIHRLQLAEISDLEVPTPTTWDRHWRIVIFDIPHTYKNQRYIFISQLRRLGFVMVRQSTWYHPYPCHDIIDAIVRHCGLSQHISIVDAVSLDDSTTRKLLRAFPQLDYRDK